MATLRMCAEKIAKGTVTVSEERQAAEVKIKQYLAAISEDNQVEVNKLLGEGVPLDCADDSGQSTIFFAVESKSRSMLQMLLDKGAWGDYKDEKGMRPIMRAIQLGDDALPLVELLLNAKGEDKLSRMVDLEVKAEHDGATLLHIAAWSGWPCMMKALLETGAYKGKMEEMNHQGQTVMHVAAMRSPVKIVEMLKEHGSSVDAVEKNGRRLSKDKPADFANNAGMKKNAEFLVSIGGATNVMMFNKKMAALRKKE